MVYYLRLAFFVLLVRPFIYLIIGLRLRHRRRLPSTGPAIIIANHNSHLDALVIMCLFPLSLLPKLRPVAAADYFLDHGGALAWFARQIIGIIPLRRGSGQSGSDPFAECHQALAEDAILILFPEGTRGEPEQLGPLRKGIAHLAAPHPQVPVIPVYLYGLGKSLPRGDWLPVPFFCDVLIGHPLTWCEQRDQYLTQVQQAFDTLAAEGGFPRYSV